MKWAVCFVYQDGFENYHEDRKIVDAENITMARMAVEKDLTAIAKDKRWKKWTLLEIGIIER